MVMDTIIDKEDYIEKHKEMLLYIKEQIKKIESIHVANIGIDLNDILTPYWTSYGLYSLRLEKALELRDK